MAILKGVDLTPDETSDCKECDLAASLAVLFEAEALSGRIAFWASAVSRVMMY